MNLFVTAAGTDMNGIAARFGAPPGSLWPSVLLVLVAPLGNLLHVPILFDVYLIFGSTAAMLALMMAGMPTAVLAAITAGAVTGFLWSHPYVLINGILEVLVVGFLHRHWRQNLIIASMLYWLVFGIPFIAFCYYYQLGNEATTTGLIVLKQSLNGVLNAILATLIFIAVQAISGNRASPSNTPKLAVTDTVFITLVLGIAIAGTTPIAIEGHRDQDVQESFVSQRLNQQADLLAERLQRNARQNRIPLDQYLRQSQTSPDLGLAILDQQGEPLARQGSVKSLGLNGGTTMPREDGLSLWLPDDARHALQRWQAGAYNVRHPVHDTPGIAEVILELPAAPLVERIRTNQLRLLVCLFAIVMCGTVAAWFLSALLTRPLVKLTKHSQDLTHRITTGQRPQLPGSLFREYNNLASTLNDVSGALGEAFQSLSETRDALAQRVDDQTREITNTSILLDSVLNAATEVSIIATDTDGIITIFNRGAEQMLGYSASQMVGRCTPTLIHDPQEMQLRGQELSDQLGRPVAGFDVFTARTADGHADIHDWTYIHRDGRRFPVSLIVTAIIDGEGKTTGYVGVALDISERKRMDKLKDEFISTVSHELRTPLTSISGSLSLLLNETVGKIPPALKPMLTIADKNATRLIHLVNDLLDLQKIASGKMEFQITPHPLDQLLSEAVEQNRPYGQERRVSIDLEPCATDITVNVDRERLLQVMANLLSNAIKFSSEDAAVEVRANVNPATGNVTVEVEDHGCGIPSQFHSRVFQRFAQADASDTRSKGGTGLGLAITRELVERMGGQVSFHSEEGRGSTFRVVLPLSSAPQSTVATPVQAISGRASVDSSTEEPPERPLVLHVEDDQDLHSVIRTATAHRFELIWAANLEEAREHVQNLNFQLIILDIGLPDGSGWQLLPDMSLHQPEAHIVILSGKSLDSNQLDQVEATFTKSQTSMDVLVTSLEACLEQRPKLESDRRSD
ncbi:ATP-binding protein [Marinobacter xestospongiae]|uniref:histidine kinase n=1 Tax=Marinobacter xestospongiae TaxID=994319 RepID=A0ABU3VVJ3_9GAMM|nr:ATP-binding protein [Marinobacter xestospongiae]MDV2078289.1 ATP-binding protein [Marinobacter xestospongiae]